MFATAVWFVTFVYEYNIFRQALKKWLDNKPLPTSAMIRIASMAFTVSLAVRLFCVAVNLIALAERHAS